LPQGVVDFSAGVGDSLLLGQGGRLRSLFGVDGGIDPSSSEYFAGEMASLAAGGMRLTYAAAAKGFSFAGSMIGGMEGAEFASAARNALKVSFRGGLFADYRTYSFTEVAARYGNDWNAIISAAGRTNPLYNWLGIQTGGGAAANRLQQCLGSGC
jgi:hypothetical protein